MIGLCEQFSCLPSALLAEDARAILRRRRIIALGRPEPAQPEAWMPDG